MRFYWLRPVEPSRSRFTGEYSAARKWYLPGVHCSGCNASWGDDSAAYPCVDLSGLKEQGLFSARLEEDFVEFERLCALLRPLLPAGVLPRPGTALGPLVGSARGSFGQLVMQYAWALLIRREALEQLQAEGLRGLKGCGTQLRFRQKSAPELLELQVEPRGLLHADCLPPQLGPACAKCGHLGLTLPEQPLLELASLPEDQDLFRLANACTMLIGTERWVDTVQRLGLEEVEFRELPAR